MLRPALCSHRHASLEKRRCSRSVHLGRLACRMELGQRSRLAGLIDNWHTSPPAANQAAVAAAGDPDMHPQLQLDGGGAAGGGPGGNNGSRRQLTGEADNGGSRSSSMRLVLQALLLSAGLQLSHAAPAAAAGRSRLVSKQDERLLPDWEMDAFIDQMWDLSGPILNNMGFSGLLGAASAAALKCVGRTLAASVGMALLLVQVLSYYNVITVNWSVVHQQAQQVLDRTGDGRLDSNDFKRFVKKGMIILSEGVPSISGFMVGFIVGLKVF